MRSDSLRLSHGEDWACNTVPQWEKQFCLTVGSIPWRKFLEMKSYTHLYHNIVTWDDSAGKEAFDDAKNRFWTKIKGLPCDKSLPDTDIYIDDVDWDSGVDPELLLDLEREPKPLLEQSRDENAVPLTEALLMSQSFSCTGWGESEEHIPKANESQNHLIDPCEPRNFLVKANGWDCNRNEWSHNGSKNLDAYRWQTWGENRNRATGWYDSRYKTSRFPSNYYHVDRAYR